MPRKTRARISSDTAADALEAANAELDRLNDPDQPWNDPSLKPKPKPRPTPSPLPPPPPRLPDPMEEAERLKRRNRKLERATRPVTEGFQKARLGKKK